MKKRHVCCPKCKSVKTVRNGKRKLKKRLIQRFLCRHCRYSFSLRHLSRSRVSYHQRVKLTRLHLEGRTSIRTLSRHSGYSTKTITESIHTITKQCVSAAWIAKHLKPKWSGYLALDGKTIRVWDWAAKHFHYTKEERRWLHKMTLLVALDLETLDIPTHHLGEEETAIDLVMFLKNLRNSGYHLKGYVSDGNLDIPRAVRHVFGSGIPHQLCVRHFLQGLRVKLRNNSISHLDYQDACHHILTGKKPHFLKVPKTLFTYQNEPSLPRTNQACENLLRFLSLRLKTLGQFKKWQYAADYYNALILMRRFTPFTDRKEKPNGLAPLELAGCDLTNHDYFKLNPKINR